MEVVFLLGIGLLAAGILVRKLVKASKGSGCASCCASCEKLCRKIEY